MTKTLGTAQRDLERAEKTFNDKDYKWATIQSYYSMFHSTRALLFAKNYREHSHYCLIVAMRALYVETRLLPGSLIEALGKGKRLREDADYYDRWSEEGASFALKAAGDFLNIFTSKLIISHNDLLRLKVLNLSNIGVPDNNKPFGIC